MTIKRFEKLEIWQKARELCKKIRGVAETSALGKDFSLKDQILRSHFIGYFDYLSNVMLVIPVKRGDISGCKIFEIGEKYYFNDIGLLNALIPYN